MKQLLLIFLFCLTGLSALAENKSAPWPDAKGNGTLVDPWLIESVGHLNALATSVNGTSSTAANDYAGCYFALSADIGTSSANSDVTVIGTDLDRPFRGCMDGRGYNLYINVGATAANGYALAGLFGYLGKDAVLSNINIAGGKVTATAAAVTDRLFAGAIAALVENGATVRNCVAAATVTCAGKTDAPAKMAYVGNLVAYNLGEVVNCVASGTVRPVATDIAAGKTNLGTGIGANGTVGELFGTAYAVKGKVSLPEGHAPATITVALKDGETTIASGTGSSPFAFDLGTLIPWMDGAYTLAVSAAGLYAPQTIAIDLSKPTPDITLEASFFWYTDGTSPYQIRTVAELRSLAQIVNGTVPGGADFNWNGKAYPYDFYHETICLAEDIDLSSVANWEPIGFNKVKPFSGTFDGAGKTISNLKAKYDGNKSTCSWIGLFGMVKFGSIHSFTLCHADITSHSENITGAVVGEIDYTTLSDIAIEGKFRMSIGSTSSGSAVCGGMLGTSRSSLIANCSLLPSNAEGIHIEAVQASGVGGITGECLWTTITNCYTSVRIKCQNNSDIRAGGISGTGTAGVIRNCYASGEINAASTYGSPTFIGGITGQKATVTCCYALGSTITAKRSGSGSYKANAGRIVGNSNDKIFDCYANAGMTLGREATGLDGTDMAALGDAPWWKPGGTSIVETLNAYVASNPTVEVEGNDKDNNKIILTATLSRWLPGAGATQPASLAPRYAVTGKVAGGDASIAITILSDGKIAGNGKCAADGSYKLYLSDGTYTIAAASADGKEGSADVTVNGVKVSVPDITLEAPYAWYTDGTSPYRIQTAAELRALAHIVNKTVPAGTTIDWKGKAYPFNFYDQTICLAKDIDLKNTAWEPIGLDFDMGGDDPLTALQFCGTFDGGGKTISNLRIESDKYPFCGLFGALTGTLKQLTLSNVTINNTANEAEKGVVVTGSFVGFGIMALVTDVCLTGDVSVSAKVATLGENEMVAVGGIMGAGIGTIMNCSVQPSNNAEGHIRITAPAALAGGVLGYGEVTVTNCFSTANLHVTCNDVRECDAGGIAATATVVRNSYASGTITAVSDAPSDNFKVGGVCGIGWIENCYALGSSITASGATVFRVAGSGDVSNCYANPEMTVNGSKVTTPEANGLDGDNLTTLASAPWWRLGDTEDFDDILAALNAYVDENPSIENPLFGGYLSLSRWLPGTAAAQPASFAPRYAVTGKVAGGDATVEITVLSGGKIAVSGKCAADGSYTLYLSDGTYTIKALSADGKEGSASVTVNGAVVAVPEITLSDPYAWYTQGTSSDYTIKTSAELQALARIVNETVPAETTVDWNGKDYPSSFSGQTIRLAADIDLGGFVNWEPIGLNNGKPFSGIFDGQGKTISNLKTDYNKDGDTHRYIGLFGRVTYGELRSFTLCHVDVTSHSLNLTGAVAGSIGTTLLSDVAVTGKYHMSIYSTSGGGSTSGGLVGEANSSLIANCSLLPANTEEIHIKDTQPGWVGGITGSNSYSTIANCYTAVRIWAENSSEINVGGIAGGSGTILNCYTSGEINTTTRGATTPANIGGIIGKDGTTIDGCYALGSRINAIRGSGYPKPEKATGHIFAGRIGARSCDNITNCYGNANMNVTCENVTPTGDGTALTPLDVAPWWEPGGMPIVAALNAYVTANPTVEVKIHDYVEDRDITLTATLRPWAEGTGAQVPAIFVATP